MLKFPKYADGVHISAYICILLHIINIFAYFTSFVFVATREAFGEKCQNNRVVSIGDGSRHQVCSFLGGLLGDQQVHSVHILTYT